MARLKSLEAVKSSQTMPSVQLETVYEVPSWKDPDGSTWRKHLDASSFAGSTGWAVGAEQILYTRDSGRSWTSQFEHLCGKALLPTRVCAVDGQTAWLVAVSHVARNNCFHTTNAGREWIEKRLPDLLHPTDVFFLDQKHGWIISDDGDIPAGNATIYITNDGGDSWQSRKLEIKGSPRRVKFFTPDDGLLLQHTANESRTRTICNLLRSKDAGRSWRVVYTFGHQLMDFSIANPDTLFVVGVDGFISKSVNAGLDWRRLATSTRDCFNVIRVQSDGEGVAGGDFGLILTTRDYGDHWESCGQKGAPYNIVDASFVDQHRAILTTSTRILALTFDDASRLPDT